jgi:hypothetical protein
LDWSLGSINGTVGFGKPGKVTYCKVLRYATLNGSQDELVRIELIFQRSRNWLLGLFIGLFTFGCGIEIYGKAERYDLHNRPEFEVTLPPNAPYISEQFTTSDEAREKNHPGIDIWSFRGAEILAAAPGRVSKSFYEPAFGNQIILDHGVDASGARILTDYKHLHERLVEPGQVVARGQKIGTMGATGLMGMMVHLHFEVWRDLPHRETEPLDPNLFWMDGPGKVTCFDRTSPLSQSTVPHHLSGAMQGDVDTLALVNWGFAGAPYGYHYLASQYLNIRIHEPNALQAMMSGDSTSARGRFKYR